jgi:hypothetical protein
MQELRYEPVYVDVRAFDPGNRLLRPSKRPSPVGRIPVARLSINPTKYYGWKKTRRSKRRRAEEGEERSATILASVIIFKPAIEKLLLQQ